jgi:hypothetical protein
MIESQSFVTHSQVSPARRQSSSPSSRSNPSISPVVVDEVVGRVGALGAHADGVLREGAAGGERQGGGQEDVLHGVFSVSSG